MSLDDLEKKVEDFSKDIEKRFEEFTRRIEDKFSGDKKPENGKNGFPCVPRKHDTTFWGIILVIIGVVLLGNYFHWFYLDVPIFPTALVILGVYLIIEHQRRH